MPTASTGRSSAAARLGADDTAPAYARGSRASTSAQRAASPDRIEDSVIAEGGQTGTRLPI